jgi:hypothetical protein
MSMPQHLKDALRVFFNIAVASVLFGYWQMNGIAGAFMFFFLLSVYGAISQSISQAKNEQD